MALPAGYTEATLSAYMHAVLGPVATALSWTVVAGSYQEAVNEAVALMATDDVTTIAGREAIMALRAAARREVWRAVMQATAGHYDVNTDGASRDRSQMHKQALEQFTLADSDLAMLGVGTTYAATIETVDYGDPYGPAEQGV